VIFDRLRAVDYCGTSSLLVRAAAWDAVGGLDERFYPAYYVDVDLSMALRQIGLAVLFQPRSRIRHYQGASTNPRFRSFVSQRNRLLFMEKWSCALQAQEPPERESPAAVERALARAEALAARLRQGPPARFEPLTKAPFDPVLQGRCHFEKSRALQEAYVAHLEKDRDEWRHTALAQRRELANHRARSKTFASIERGWRRIYRIFQSLKGS
jgi:hypothetical protein